MDYNREFPSKFVYLPKIGETATFSIKTIKKALGDNPKFNFSETKKVDIGGGEIAEVKKDLGYHIECELQDSEQILSINSLGAFLQVFKGNNVQEGETITVKHIAKGEWEVTKQ